MKKISLYILVLTINLLLFQCGFQYAGGSEVWGKVAEVNGEGVPGVSVKLYQSNGDDLNDTTTYKDSVISVVTTDLRGEYHFKDLNPGQYSISGFDAPSERVFLRRDIVYDSGNKVRLPDDTLETAGELLVIFNGADVDLDQIPGIISGTPYSGQITNDSLFIRGIVPGSYQCKVATHWAGGKFLPFATGVFQIQSGQRTVIVANLEATTAGQPPAPENLTIISMDTLNSTVVLRWDSVRVGDLIGYRIYRGTDINKMDPVKLDIRNTFDTVPMITDSIGISIVNYFQVVSVDSSIEEGKSTPLEIMVPSPMFLKTKISDTLVAPLSKLYIGDTALIVASFCNDGRSIDSIIWAIDKMDSVVRKISCIGADPTNHYIDTMKFVWDDSLAKTWYITAIDNSGASVTMVKRVTGSGMYPPDTWHIYPVKFPLGCLYSTAVSDGTMIYILGGARYKIDSGSNNDLVPIDAVDLFSPDSSVPFSSSTMKLSRYNHSSFLYNGKIFSIGGITKKATLSTIEIFDPVTKVADVIDTLPYARAGASASVVGTKVYIIGGRIINDTLNGVTGSVDVYDLNLLGKGQGAITHLGELLVPRANHSAVVHNDKIIVIGGLDTTSSYSLSSVESFDFETGISTSLPEMAQNRTNFSATLVDNKVFVFGGCYENRIFLNSVEVLDLGNKVGWEFVSPMNSARFGMVSMVHNGKIYLMGGRIVQGNNTVYDTTINVYYP